MTPVDRTKLRVVAHGNHRKGYRGIIEIGFHSALIPFDCGHKHPKTDEARDCVRKLVWRLLDASDIAATLAPTPPDALDPCPHCVMQHVWPCPTIRRCDEPGCDRETSCGFPTPSGYRRTCGDHYRAALEANHAPHLLPEAEK